LNGEKEVIYREVKGQKERPTVPGGISNEKMGVSKAHDNGKIDNKQKSKRSRV